MFELRLGDRSTLCSGLVLPVGAASGETAGSVLLAGHALLAEDLPEISAFLRDVEHSGAAGVVHCLPRPGRTPRALFLVGVGAGAQADWRSAGAAVVRAANRHPGLAVVLPRDVQPGTIGALAEAMWLADYRYRLAAEDLAPDGGPVRRLADVVLLTHDGAPWRETEPTTEALARASAIATAVSMARDLTNTPSDRKNPGWLADQIVAAATNVADLTAAIWDADRLAIEGFQAVLAVGRGSVHPPRLVRLSWNPPRPAAHVVLVGKGVTFDSGGIDIKPRDSMKLMRKDMGGAAAVLAATWCAATLRLPVRVTALAPLAENAVSGRAMRPGDVVRHPGGVTSEVLNTDAEGRLLLADVLGYAATAEQPDVLIDLATLTGAQNVALGKKTAALFTDADDLAGEIAAAAAVAGESVWRLPLVEDYVDSLRSDVAEIANVPLDSADPGAGAVTAALYLREFTGPARSRWVHLDMSAPAWSDSATGELAKGATGWGVRTLVAFLESAALRGSE